MFVTMKSKDGYPVDVTRTYIDALSGKITKDEFKRQMNVIKNSMKYDLKYMGPSFEPGYDN